MFEMCPPNSLFELFIKTLIHYPKKHLMILEFLMQRLKEESVVVK